MDWKQLFRFHNPRFRKICIVLLVIGKLGANVLYSDGFVKRLPSEEVEKILAELPSVPIKADSEAQNEAEP